VGKEAKSFFIFPFLLKRKKKELVVKARIFNPLKKALNAPAVNVRNMFTFFIKYADTEAKRCIFGGSNQQK
jgi:hypothetical protein